MAFDSETLKWGAAAYILMTSAVSFYIIFLSTQVQTRLGAEDWVNQKNLADTQDLALLKQFKDTSYNYAIATVVLNFFIMSFIILTKFKLSIRG